MPKYQLCHVASTRVRETIEARTIREAVEKLFDTLTRHEAADTIVSYNGDSAALMIVDDEFTLEAVPAKARPSKKR